MNKGFLASDRAVLKIGGPEARDFLQGLITNDIGGVEGGAVYAAMLSPQGKYLFDFIILPDGEDLLIDVAADREAALRQRLTMYRLRKKVEIAPAHIAIVVLLAGDPPVGALYVADPRHPALGKRIYTKDPDALLEGLQQVSPEEWAHLRVKHTIPESGIELVPEETYVLEAGFERLHGVDFRKGCYVGQEVTARMKHKTILRKGLAQVRVEGDAPPPGTEILRGDKVVGTLYTTGQGLGLAHLRLDRAVGPLRAGSAHISVLEVAL